MVSSGEDGQVLLWDFNQAMQVTTQTFTPFHLSVSRWFHLYLAHTSSLVSEDNSLSYGISSFSIHPQLNCLIAATSNQSLLLRYSKISSIVIISEKCGELFHTIQRYRTIGNVLTNGIAQMKPHALLGFVFFLLSNTIAFGQLLNVHVVAHTHDVRFSIMFLVDHSPHFKLY